MKPDYVGMILGGVVPAILFGLSGVFQKTSQRAGIGTGPYLIVVGAVVLAMGIGLSLVQGDWTRNRTSVLHTMACAALWGLGMFCIAVALSRYQAQISQLVPLYNMNTLVAVAVGLWALKEWRTVHPGMLVAATVLTTAGGLLAAFSSR